MPLRPVGVALGTQRGLKLDFGSDLEALGLHFGGSGGSLGDTFSSIWILWGSSGPIALVSQMQDFSHVLYFC